jgi:quinol monooxygenase YgiN
MSQPVHVIATFAPRDGHAEAVEALLRGMVAPSRAEPGCWQYDLFRTQGTPAAFVIAESYANPAALEAHRRTAHYQAYRAGMGDLLDAPIQVQLLTALDATEG